MDLNFSLASYIARKFGNKAPLLLFMFKHLDLVEQISNVKGNNQDD